METTTKHSVHKGVDLHGEVDLVVLPNGNVLLMEVKAGQVLRNATYI